MIVTASNRAVFQGVGGWQMLIALTPEQAVEMEKLKDKDLDIEIHRVHRSLNANAYFHVLCRELAKKLDSSEEEIKTEMVIRYGSYLRGDDGKKFGACIPAEADVTKLHPYFRRYGEVEINGKPYIQWLFLKRTSDLNTAEMSDLITGVVSECHEVGVETMPPKELEELLKSWGCVKNAKSDEPSTGII